MTHNELNYVAKQVHHILWSAGWLRGSSRTGPAAILQAIEKARKSFASDDEQRMMTILSDGASLLKKTIRSLIPPTFGWWLEMDHDVRISVRWLWLGHPAVVHSGSVSDTDVTIMLALLRGVDWDAEAAAAMENVEAAEAKLLRSAQERRRIKLTDKAHLVALPPVELGTPVAISFNDKLKEIGPGELPIRRATREEMAAKLAAALAQSKADLENMSDGSAEEEDSTPLYRRKTIVFDGNTDETPEAAATNEPTNRFALTFRNEGQSYEERHASPEDTTRRVHEDGLPPLQFGLSRQLVRPALCRIQFEPYPSIRAVLNAIKANPRGTYTEAYLYGGICRLQKPEFVQRMVSNKPLHGGRIRREMTDREFRRIDTGEPRRCDKRFSRAG